MVNNQPANLFEAAFDDARANVANVIEKKWKDTAGANDSSLSTIQGTMRMLYASLYTYEGKIQLGTKSCCRDLISCGFLFSQRLADQINKNSSGPWTVDIREEPIAAKALQDIGDNYILGCNFEDDQVMMYLGSTVVHQVPPVSFSSKGITAELLLSWYLLSYCIKHRGKRVLLRDALGKIVSSPWPERFEKATIHFNNIVDVQGQCGFSYLFELDDPLHSLVWNIDTKSGTDIAFCCNMDPEAENKALGMVAIQSKSGGFEFADAIRSVTPGYQYCDNTATKKRTALQKLLRETNVQQNWLRVLFCTKTPTSSLRQYLQKANSEAHKAQPIVILTSSSTFNILNSYKASQFGNRTLIGNLQTNLFFLPLEFDSKGIVTEIFVPCCSKKMLVHFNFDKSLGTSKFLNCVKASFSKFMELKGFEKELYLPIHEEKLEYSFLPDINVCIRGEKAKENETLISVFIKVEEQVMECVINTSAKPLHCKVNI